MRGRAQLESIRAALNVLGEVREHIVLIGGCALALYARPVGAPLRATKDVDCLSTVTPWIRQEELLGRLCAFGELVPDPEAQFRYRKPGTDLVIDVISPDGLNIGGGTKWLRPAAQHAGEYAVGPDRMRAVTPPYFLVLKLAAFIDRGTDLRASPDMEDIVYLAVELDDLVAQVAAAGLASDIAALWSEVFRKHQVDASYVADIVDSHLHPADGDRRSRAIATLTELAPP